jgi:hypothetical protein
MACIKKTEQKNIERMDINTLDQKSENFILLNKGKHRCIDDHDNQL